MSKTKRSAITGKPVTTRIPAPAGGVRIETLIPWSLVKREVRRQVITPIETPAEFREEVQRETQRRTLEKHSPLLRALGLAHYWLQLLDEGTFRSITEIAAAEGMDVGRVSRILRLAQLSPAILERCMAEGLPDPQQSTSSRRLRNANLCDWNKQDKCLAESQFVLEPEASPDPIDHFLQVTYASFVYQTQAEPERCTKT